MLTLERDATVSVAPRRRSGSTDARVFGTSTAQQIGADQRWVTAFNSLKGLLDHPEDLLVDGLQPPTQESVHFATLFLAGQQRNASDIPTMIVPTGEGGVAIEWRTPGDFTRVEFGPTGLMEATVIQSGVVIQTISEIS
jgi:hypothetical protein